MFEDREFWIIIDTRTNRRVSINTWLSEETAQRSIQEWIIRCYQGHRPDIPLEQLLALRPKRLGAPDQE